MIPEYLKTKHWWITLALWIVTAGFIEAILWAALFGERCGLDGAYVC